MKLYRDEAIVLRTHKLGEADRIITLLSRGNGLIRGVAKGVRRTSSRFGARLEPFTVVDIQLHQGRNLDTITQVETLAAYGGELSEDYPRYTAGTLIVETALRLSEDEPGTNSQYHLLLGALHALSVGAHHPTAVLSSYLLRALSLAGWAPSCGHCARCEAPGPHGFFNVTGGGAVCSQCRPPGSVSVELSVAQLLGALLSGDWPSADQACEADLRGAQGIVVAYTQWHLEHRLRSLPLLELA